ncbi:phosphoadenylyl-sulfate reductase [Thalassorhabdus alkalitolerans]|uniref:Adenosine 5'-phosphosulfate reductase n=1 Tax=Thalassorhabdus alkalitolerans TaxID=2282697 RepID=A0ABW0YH70_9BACI
MILDYPTTTQEEVEKVNEELDGRNALDIVKWGYETYGDDLVYACSLGAEGMVLLDLINRVKPGARVVFLDTDFHFKQTYDLLKKVREHFPDLSIESIKPELSVKEQSEQYGDKLWETAPDKCCALRKLEPLEKELSKHKAWMSGLRREQSPTRKNTQFVNIDNRFQSIKIAPLIHWTWDEVWEHIKENNLPYNILHDQNFPSIGCFHCTSAVLDGQDSRSGRWSGSGKTECGLHKE